MTKQQIDLIVGRNIKEAREGLNMSRMELSEILNLSISHLGLIERGERGAKAKLIYDLMRALEVPADYFFKRPKNPKSFSRTLLVVRDSQENVDAKEAEEAEIIRAEIKNHISVLYKRDLKLVSLVARGMYRKAIAEESLRS